ncbi:MAG: cyclic nucleotide-binding domain-containing protein, partial [Varibaculum cambriense]
MSLDSSFLARVPLFEGLDQEAQMRLFSMMGQTTLRRGENLFEEGDDGDRLYIVAEGKIKLSHQSLDGRENLLAVLGPGEILGELTLFDPGQRSTTATAVSPARLVFLNHSDLMVFLEDNPSLAKH